MLVALLVESSEINQNKRHYDYRQGIGRIVGSYHYLHFNIDVTTLLKTFKHITASYVILSNHGELREEGTEEAYFFYFLGNFFFYSNIYKYVQKLAQNHLVGPILVII